MTFGQAVLGVVVIICIFLIIYSFVGCSTPRVRSASSACHVDDCGKSPNFTSKFTTRPQMKNG